MADIERRRDPRVPFVLRVEYPGVDGAVLDATEDLSAGGLFIRTERQLAVGERLYLVLSFPRLLAPLELEVEVVRQRSPASGEPPGLAVKIPQDKPEGREQLARLAQAALASAKGETAAGRGYRVLLVEDNPLVTEMYVRALADAGNPVTTESAGNGLEALERIFSSPPDLVISDLFMPIMDGFTLIERLRGDSRTEHLPVVVITAGGNEARERAADLGVDVYLQKPVRFANLANTVRTLLTSTASPSAS
jgi:uncharacterized protein (TIGR02266 family)